MDVFIHASYNAVWSSIDDISGGDITEKVTSPRHSLSSILVLCTFPWQWPHHLTRMSQLFALHLSHTSLRWRDTRKSSVCIVSLRGFPLCSQEAVDTQGCPLSSSVRTQLHCTSGEPSQFHPQHQVKVRLTHTGVLEDLNIAFVFSRWSWIKDLAIYIW